MNCFKMAELNKIRLILYASLMIFPAQALDVIFSSALEDFKQQSKINTYIEDGEKKYGGTLDPLTYQPDPDTSKVIVHIIDMSRFVEIIRNAVRGIILQIAQELKEWHCELVFLGIDNFDVDEYHLISAFMLEKIQPQNEDQPNFIIETIGENHFDRVYPCFVMNIERYRENVQICGGTLRARLRNIPRGALRPVGRNGKEVRLYGYHPNVREVSWPVRVVNDIYFPVVNVSDSKYNLRIRYKRKKICLLIVGGKEYSVIHSRGRTSLKTEMVESLRVLTKNNEGLFFLGIFNFEWTEIDIVTQIIFQHLVTPIDSDYNICTYGYGMFNTNYRNVFGADGSDIFPQPKTYVRKLIKVLMGKEVKDRSINMYFTDDGEWDFQDIPIKLNNGRYTAAEKFKNYTFPWVNQEIVFIVHSSTEMSDATDYSMVHRSADELKWSGICVVLIEAFNFGPDDIHIIAEWIDYHRGIHAQNADGTVIDSKQIAVLGGGIFETIFQSELTTYNTLLDTKRNELTNIRNAFVNNGNGKRIFAAKVDKSSDPKFEVWTYPMNTVNGFYEPDLIPNKNMFDTTDGKNIFLITTSANFFQRISKISAKNMNRIKWLGEKMEKHLPHSNWSIYLVGLDNLREQDNHLLAELAKRQTKDERRLEEFVCTFGYGLSRAVHQYKDNPPIPIENRYWVQSHVSTFFEVTCKLPDFSKGTSLIHTDD